MRPPYRLPAFCAFLGFAVLGYVAGRWNGMLFSWSIGWKTSQFFFNYQQLGFVSRGLVGTLLHPFPALLSPPSLYVMSWAMIIGFAWMLARLFAAAAGTGRRSDVTLMLVICAASPAMFQRQGFDLGRFDVLEMMIALTSIAAIAVRRWWVIGVLTVVALLIHEAYAVIHFPLVLALYVQSADRSRASDAQILVPAAVAFGAVMTLGKYESGLDALIAHYRNDPLFLRAVGGTVDPDAVMVITRSLPETFKYTLHIFVQKRAILHVPIIIVWGAVMVAFATQFFRQNRLRPGLAFYACFSPLALSVIACDYYRWVALLATNLFVLILLEAARLTREGRGWETPRGTVTWVLLATSLLGPISNTKSFPFWFTLLERAYPGLWW